MWNSRVIASLLLIGASVVTSPAAASTGTTIDYAWDGGEQRNRAWYGRAYVPEGVDPDTPLPVIVFLHGLNKILVKHRWMGGGPEDDLRTRLDDWIAGGVMPKMIIVGPSSTVKSEVFTGASWRHFELDHFMKLTRRALHGHARIDDDQIVLAGHSGAGCSLHGGLATADAASTRLHAMLAIDTCMDGAFGKRLGETSPETHVVVGYQKLGWTRSFKAFERSFRETVEGHPVPDGILRELDEQKPERDYHNATVPLTFERWLPKLLGLPEDRTSPK